MKGKVGAIILAIILILGIAACVICMEKIPAGYVGVVYNMNGGVDVEVLTQGWHPRNSSLSTSSSISSFTCPSLSFISPIMLTAPGEI